MEARTYKTGEVAKLAGITLRTLRYYDAIGLLKPGRVLENGHRRYDAKDIEKLQLILGLKLLDFSLEDIQTVLQKPEINLVDILTYQKQALTRKISAYTAINSRIDFIVEHYRGTDPERAADIFSLYEMLQVVNHNEVLRKYLPEAIQEAVSADAHGRHDELDKALALLAGRNGDTLAAKDRAFVKETFHRFIGDCFGEVTTDTIRKTTQMLAELAAGDASGKIDMDESDVYQWLCTNLMD